ncbi:MAG: DUF2399 domain-containing protein [Treponema sp.]|jgi:hypothetical protein|nr:DUF2399 domain-containing protein [Treponema sp.]
MTVWEQRIIEAFLTRYPSSAAAAGGRALRIQADRIFPEFGAASPDERESFLEAAESLAGQGLLSLIWRPHLKHEALQALVCPDAGPLFALAGKPSPSNLALAARETAARWEAKTSGAFPFLAFLAENLRPEDAAQGIDSKAVEDFSRLLAEGAERRRVLTLRGLSVALYADSKRLEALLRLFSRLLRRAGRQGITIPDLSDLARSFPEAWIAGRLVFFLKDSEDKLTHPGGIIALSLPLIRRIRALEVPLVQGRLRALSVENKESFYVLAESLVPGSGGQGALPFDCVLYTGGHPNEAVRALAGLLAAAGCDFRHAGDLDPDGILILREMAQAAGQDVRPFKMDAETFDFCLPHSRKLPPSILRRLKLLEGGAALSPEIRELIQRIKDTGRGVEQEIISYSV